MTPIDLHGRVRTGDVDVYSCTVPVAVFLKPYSVSPYKRPETAINSQPNSSRDYLIRVGSFIKV